MSRSSSNPKLEQDKPVLTPIHGRLKFCKKLVSFPATAGNEDLPDDSALLWG